ncbi:hypothetical protein CAEBREN_08695 [Caenorhabditis brenneri]|uniref:DNA sliding clamp PCNA n=1 Tax=Caenorhabditis brenneri TaxID=135651 RepID=G0P9W5_CAEBE|nr:hypothetical protein CAEBREN_08695 [Caenorhabditis brenneri]
MFDVELRNSVMLRTVVETSKALIENISFRVNENGMYFSAMGFAKSVGIDFFLPKSFFKEFRCTEMHTFTMSTKSLINVLKTSAPNESCQIQMSSPNADVVHITFTDDSTGKVRKTTTRLEEEPEEPVDRPQQTEYYSIVQLDSLEFQKEISNLHVFKVINVKTTTDGMIFSGKNETQKFETTFKSTNHDLNSSIVMEIRQNTNSDFNRDPLEIVSRATISDTVELRIGKSLRVKYTIGDNGYLKYYLASRIDTEDEMEE